MDGVGTESGTTLWSSARAEAAAVSTVSQPGGGLTAKALSGATWMVVSSTAGRVVALLGQVAIGWLLKPEDFGAWALALAMSSAVMSLRNGGTTQILIQRGHSYAAE